MHGAQGLCVMGSQRVAARDCCAVVRDKAAFKKDCRAAELLFSAEKLKTSRPALTTARCEVRKYADTDADATVRSRGRIAGLRQPMTVTPRQQAGLLAHNLWVTGFDPSSSLIYDWHQALCFALGASVLDTQADCRHGASGASGAISSRSPEGGATALTGKGV